MFPIVYRGYSGIRKVTSERCPDPRISQQRIILDNHITPETQFTNVDFVPSFCKKLKDTIIYHNFSSLVNLANDWLISHPGWDIINCETVTQYSHQVIDSVDYSAVINILRVWVKRRSNEPPPSLLPKETHLWFKDFVPEQRTGGHTSSSSTHRFEPLERVIDKINKAIVEGRINGKIIQMETLKVPATDEWTFRPETTYCNDGRTTRDIQRFQNYVIVIRVFFLAGPLFDHEVVLADFVPFDLSSDTFARRNGEKFSSMITRAALWLQENTELTLVNVQAVDIHVPDPDAETIETRITWKRKENTDKEIRFLRIYCTKRNEISKLFIPYESLSVSSLEYKLYLTAIAFNVKSFQQDINEWYLDLVQRNADTKQPRIINIETVVVPPFVNDQSGKSFQHSVDETLSCNQMEGRFKYSFVAIRVYYDECGLDTGDFQITRLP